MNKTILMGAGFFSLLLTAVIIITSLGWEIAAHPALAQDGPVLSASSQSQQNESDETKDENNGDKSDSVSSSGDEYAGADMPQMDPSPDSPDAPVKTNVEGPVEDKADIQAVEDDKQPANETHFAKPADNSGVDKPAAGALSQPEEPAAVEPPKPKRELSPAMIALRDKVRRTLAIYQKLPFNTRQNTADEIINYSLAFGCNAEIFSLDSGGEKRVNAIACLCWNYSCGGFEPFTLVDGHISARLGYGTQSRPSQVLAALALARVQVSYPLRVGDIVRTVADLVESEKLSCRTGADMSLKLIGLAYYVDEATWKNDLDEEWSLEKIIKEELARPSLASAGMGLDCLLGLNYAVNRREKRNLPIEGQFARAKKYVGEFQNYAFGIQNSDGSWGYYLSGKGANRDASAGLRSSGYVLEWLALSLPEDRLVDPAMAAGIAYLNNTLNQRYQNNLPALSTQEIAGTMRALHALAIYDERFFKSADIEEPATEKKPAPTTAKRESNAGSSR